MADYKETEVLKAITKATGNFSDAEKRELQRSALSIFRANEPKVFADAKTMKEAASQPTEANLFQRDYKPSGGEENISTKHEDRDLGGTFKKQIVYKAIEQQFWISHKMTDRNQYSYQEILDNKLENALLNFYRDENQLIVDWLSLNKSQVKKGDSLMNWNATNFTYENNSKEKEYFGLNMQAVMRSNGYKGAYDVISDQILFADLQKAGFNGSQNAKNTAAQLNGINPVEEITLSNNAYAGFGYGFAKGMVGMSSWIPRMNREGKGGIGENGGLYATMIDPIYGEQLAVHVYREGADTQGVGGERQDIVDYYQIFRYNTIGSAFLSTENETPVFAFGQQTELIA